MLELKEYTKEELGEILDINTEKAINLTRKLTSLGYKFTRNGKGATYRIKIIELPERGLKEFAKEHFNIECRDINKLAHLLNLLLLDNTDLPLLETTASAISHYTYLSKEKIKEYLIEFENSGLIQKDYSRKCAYATKHEIVKQEIDKDAEVIDLTNPHYTYHIIVKIITLEEYHNAYNAFYETYNTLTIRIEDNPDMIPEIAIQKANSAKKGAISGWWPCASLVIPYVVNKEWPHLSELLDILKAYKFEDYHHSYSGNAQRDYEKQIALEEEIKRKLQEKRDRLMNLQSENARLKALLEEMEKKINELKE